MTVAMGDERNPVIEAVWLATPVLTYNPYQSGNNNNLFITVVLPIVGGVILLGVAAFLMFRHLKKRKAATDGTVMESDVMVVESDVTVVESDGTVSEASELLETEENDLSEEETECTPEQQDE